MINYCLPIVVEESSAVDRLIGSENSDYRFFEVWLDYLRDYRFETMERWSLALSARLLVLFRRKNLERIRMPLEERRRLMALCARNGNLLDLDISTQREELESLRQMTDKPKVILSYHNYNETPSRQILDEMVSEMMKNGADIYKISCFCRCPEDAIRLLEVQLDLKAQERRHIVLGMGEYGAVTRVFGTLWGNEFVFAPRTAREESAPGQVCREDLEKLLAILEKR